MGSDTDQRLDRAWQQHRGHVVDVAVRMLGDRAEAEDVAQEAFTRLLGADLDRIDDVRAWLVTVTSRLCLDQLRSARRRRQSPLEAPAPADPGVPALGPRAGGPVDPADRITLDDSVRLALQVVLERLSPAERTAFVLHDVFQVSFEDVAALVGRSPAACRQLASRARRHIRSDAGAGRFAVDAAEGLRIAERFVAAVATGDLDGLLAVLDPDAEGAAEVGGRAGAAGPFVGRERVARGAMRYVGPGSGTTLLPLPTPRRPTILAVRDGEVVALLSLTVRGGVVAHIRALADRDRLAPVTAALRQQGEG